MLTEGLSEFSQISNTSQGRFPNKYSGLCIMVLKKIRNVEFGSRQMWTSYFDMDGSLNGIRVISLVNAISVILMDSRVFQWGRICHGMLQMEYAAKLLELYMLWNML